MSTKLIIGIMGKARTGKTTLGHKLQSLIPNSEVIHLADTLKSECPQIEGETKEHWRPRLIKHADAKLERYGRGYYIDKLSSNMKSDVVIIPDIRRKAEYNFLRQSGLKYMVLNLNIPVNEWISRFNLVEFTQYAGVSKDATESELLNMPLDPHVFEINSVTDDDTVEGIVKFMINKYLMED